MSNNNRAGPWDHPIREYVESLAIVVTIFNIQNDCMEKEYHLDYGKPDDRKFLGRLTFWCVGNNRSIETMSKSDWEKEKAKL